MNSKKSNNVSKRGVAINEWMRFLFPWLGLQVY